MQALEFIGIRIPPPQIGNYIYIIGKKNYENNGWPNKMFVDMKQKKKKRKVSY